MTAAGLDRETVIGALEAERERSLMAVGIAAGDFDLPPRRIEGRRDCGLRQDRARAR